MMLNEKLFRSKAVRCAAGVVEVGKSRFRRQYAEGSGFSLSGMGEPCSGI